MSKTLLEGELAFWEDMLKVYGEKRFIEIRQADLNWYCENFAGHVTPDGLGLEVGTGVISQFEFLPGCHVHTVDPLQAEYLGLLDKRQGCVVYHKGDGEKLNFPDNYFDWVACWNVIDHVDDERTVAFEMWRVLKPGGKLLLEVNYDEILSPPHTRKWDDEVLSQTMALPGLREIYRHSLDAGWMPRLCVFVVYVKE